MTSLFIILTIFTALPSAFARGLNADQSLLKETYSEAIKRRGGVVKEAVEALEHSHDALAHLERGEKKKSLGSLKTATKKIEELTSRNRALELAPIGVKVEKSELVTTRETVERLKSEAAEALSRGAVQRARSLLSGLKSETKITITSLPLKSYTAGMKQATAEIEASQLDAALATLAAALSALATEEVVYPIPVSMAEYFIDEAQRVREKKGPVDDEAIKVFAKAAMEEVRLAESLGYTDEVSLTPILRQLRDLDKSPLQDKKIFKQIKSSLAGLGPRASVTRQAQEAE